MEGMLHIEHNVVEVEVESGSQVLHEITFLDGAVIAILQFENLGNLFAFEYEHDIAEVTRTIILTNEIILWIGFHSQNLECLIVSDETWLGAIIKTHYMGGHIKHIALERRLFKRPFGSRLIML